MKPRFNIKKIRENLSGIRRGLKALTEQDVYIGVPEDETAREEAGDTGISNAYLSYIHNNGVPEKNIPGRESLIPGIKDIQAEAVELLKEAAQKSLEGNTSAINANLNKIGLLGQNAVRARFTNNDWTPLADKTLDRRKKLSETVNDKGEVKKTFGKSRRERGAINPLMDTLQLLKAHTYVIRKKGNKGMILK